MKKAKFWMFQMAMVAIISLVVGGSPAFADDENFDDQKWHDNLDAWFVKKNNEQPDKALHWEQVKNDKLAEHNAIYHPDDPSGECGPDNPAVCDDITCGLAGGAWLPDFYDPPCQFQN